MTSERVGACRSRSTAACRPRPGPAPPPAPESSPEQCAADAAPRSDQVCCPPTCSPPLLRRRGRLSPSVDPELGSQLGPPGILLALQLPKIDGGGGQVGVVERRLHRLQRRLYSAQGPGVAVTKRVQRPLQRDPGQLRRL